MSADPSTSLHQVAHLVAMDTDDLKSEIKALAPDTTSITTTTVKSRTTTKALITSTPTTTITVSSTTKTISTTTKKPSTTTKKPNTTNKTSIPPTTTTTTTPPKVKHSGYVIADNGKLNASVAIVPSNSSLTTSPATMRQASPGAMYAVIVVFTASLLLIASAALIFLFVYRRRRYRERTRLPRFENPQYTNAADFKEDDYKLYVGNTVDLNTLDRSSHWATNGTSSNNGTLKRQAPPPPNPFDHNRDDIYEMDSNPSIENIPLGTFASVTNNRFSRQIDQSAVNAPLISSSRIETDSFDSDTDDLSDTHIEPHDLSDTYMPPPPPPPKIPS